MRSIQKKYLSQIVDKSHTLICQGKECEIMYMLSHESANKILSSNAYNNVFNTKKINRLFFVWIGAINDVVIEYINVWCASIDSSSDITLYYDSNYFLYSELKNVFNSLYNIENDNIEKTINAQNDFYRKIRRLTTNGYCFDDALIMLVSMVKPSLAFTLRELKKTNQDYYSNHTHGISFIDIANRNDLFINRFYRNLYDLELTLRGNAAAASDIVRLLILYVDGGMYIDVDTLPSLDSIFGKIPLEINSNIVNVIRTEYYLRRLRLVTKKFESHNVDISSFEEYLCIHHPSILALLKNRLDATNNLSLKFHPPVVYTDSLMIASFDNLSEFNNNVMVACKGSRIVRIVLKELRRRYRHIFRRNYHVGVNDVSRDITSMSRLSNYRYDGLIYLENNVTLFLSGPSLILEVLIGVTYSILDFNKTASPLAVSYALNSELARVAYREHTNYTPEHVRPSWY